MSSVELSNTLNVLVFKCRRTFKLVSVQDRERENMSGKKSAGEGRKMSGKKGEGEREKMSGNKPEAKGGIVGNMCKRVGRVILDFLVVTSILILVPGLPPYMKFESFRFVLFLMAENSCINKSIKKLRTIM